MEGVDATEGVGCSRRESCFDGWCCCGGGRVPGRLRFDAASDACKVEEVEVAVIGAVVIEKSLSHHQLPGGPPHRFMTLFLSLFRNGNLSCRSVGP